MSEKIEQDEYKCENDRLKKEVESHKWGLLKTNEAVKVLYKDLGKKKEELNKLDKLKSDFVSTVSHELRTPLSITREGINILLDELAGPINDEQKNLLMTSKENIDRLNRIINDLLDISKIEAGKIDIRLGILDIVKLLKDLTNTYKALMASKNIELVADFSDESILLQIDKDKIMKFCVLLKITA